MANTAAKSGDVTLDVSDVDHRVGQLVGGGQLWDACSASDIRRWVMALDYPNPIHWDEDFARKSRYGGIVAPQSVCVALDYGQGAQPACVGKIAGSHLLFGGEEWWFYGHRVRPGDKLIQERRFVDYKVTDTKFAGPTMFQRGDTIHRTQHGTLVAKERATSIRYLAAEADKRKLFQKNDQVKAPSWTVEKLKQVERERTAWILSGREGVSPRFHAIREGDKLTRRVIGPHSIASFTTEYRGFVFNIWGTSHWVGVPGVKDPWINQDPGWVEGFGFDEEGAKIDPRLRDGLYVGPSRGHIDAAKGEEIGVPRAYGYGATMGGWATDYLSYWAGHDGFVRHTKLSFRGPAFEHDVTYIEGEVTGKQQESSWGVPLVTVKLQMVNQEGTLLVDGYGEVEVPL
ncbi:MAG TPA: MaoC family dehydratase N-terminal domain-containing protein [Steroidobacteraceae bacterium]|jgi:acyl dehydratase|nr:MaoC family dehydratase N-terminal domain-containing protein [Steroidobacteraceae bacterium]